MPLDVSFGKNRIFVDSFATARMVDLMEASLVKNDSSEKKAALMEQFHHITEAGIPEATESKTPSLQTIPTVDMKSGENLEIAVTNTEQAIDEDSDIEYPRGWQLTLIVISVCLYIFCMALVSKKPAFTKKLIIFGAITNLCFILILLG